MTSREEEEMSWELDFKTTLGIQLKAYFCGSVVAKSQSARFGAQWYLASFSGSSVKPSLYLTESYQSISLCEI